MKFIFSFLLMCFLFTFAGENVFAQYKKLTIILLRHAEKDLTKDQNDPNPDLSAEGKLRAQRFVKKINKYNPDIIYPSNYIRTKATVTPSAEKRRAMIFVYDPRKLDEIAAQALSGKYKRIVIVGHNTTTPALVNKLIGQQKYKTLDENEYDKIFIVKIKKKKTGSNKVKDKVLTY